MKKVCFWFDKQSQQVNLWHNIESGFLKFDLIPNMSFLYEVNFLNRLKTFDSKNLNLYLIELSYQNINSIKKHLKGTLTHFLNKYKDVSIVLYLPQEAGFRGYNSDYFKLLEDQIIDLPNKKYFFIGDIKIKEKYQNSNIKIFNKVFNFDYFEYWTYRNVNPSINKSENKEKIFLCLNRRLSFNKLALLSLLEKENFTDTGFISNLKIKCPDIEYIENAKNLLSNDDKKYINSILQRPPLILDKTHTDYPDHWIDVNYYYNNSYFSLIAETDCNRLFVTEKTYKAIIHQHPFIIWAAPFTLEYLKTKGYETYSSIFDESYDKEVDNSKRLYMIVNEVKKIVNLSSKDRKQKFKSVEKITEYNRTLFLERAEHNYKKQWKNIIEEISNDQKD